MSNKLVHMARDLIAVSEDAEWRIHQRGTGKRTSVDDFDFRTFVQTWGSTALGFGGIGGCALTTARTYVLIPHDDNEMALVYFGSQFAYEAPCTWVFWEDVNGEQMESVSRKGKYFLQEQKEVEEQCRK